MYNRLNSFLVKHNILFENQFGFRSNHNTDHAILSIVDKIQKATENRNYSCGVFLDFSKAFYSVNHKILLKKLEHYGIRGIANDWFKSYLDNCQQVVTVNNVTSGKCRNSTRFCSWSSAFSIIHVYQRLSPFLRTF